MAGGSIRTSNTFAGLLPSEMRNAALIADRAVGLEHRDAAIGNVGIAGDDGGEAFERLGGVVVGGGDAVGPHQEDVTAAGAGEREAGDLPLADVLDEVLVVVDEGDQSLLAEETA